MPGRNPPRAVRDADGGKQIGVSPINDLVTLIANSKSPGKLRLSDTYLTIETDFTEDLKQITVPVLVMHGDDDQIVPYADFGTAVGKAAEERRPENL